MYMKRVGSFGAILILCTLASVARAQTFDVSWHTIDGGGGLSSDSSFTLHGTVGQPDAGELAGGGFTLSGGYWPGAGSDSGPPCIGDLDGDGMIALSDLGILLSNFGVPSGATYEDGDLDGDGDVDLADLSQMLSVFGTTCP